MACFPPSCVHILSVIHFTKKDKTQNTKLFEMFFIVLQYYYHYTIFLINVWWKTNVITILTPSVLGNAKGIIKSSNIKILLTWSPLSPLPPTGPSVPWNMYKWEEEHSEVWECKVRNISSCFHIELREKLYPVSFDSWSPALSPLTLYRNDRLCTDLIPKTWNIIIIVVSNLNSKPSLLCNLVSPESQMNEIMCQHQQCRQWLICASY